MSFVSQIIETTGNSADRNLSPLKQALVLIEHLERELAAARTLASEPIAVVGMGCRFPGGVSNPDSYWSLLCHGIDTVGPIPEDRLPTASLYDPNRELPGKIYTRFGSFVGDVSGFDAEFFGISPREACSLDPQHRLLMEVIWETLEHSGISPASLRNSRTGVFVGIGQNDYAQRQLNGGRLEEITRFDGTGNGFCFASGRLSHSLGFRGPSISVDCACSSSLVAVHLACQSLRLQECDVALAGGVQLILSPEVTTFLCRTGALAVDGRCKGFDAAADGFGRGEGCGSVALKRLSDAVANGDFVWAIIRGNAVNHDGPSSGLTVPSTIAQTELLRRALACSGLKPESVGYIEAHGTGTQLGDPIEIEALGAVYGQNRTGKNPIWVGSAKTNHGHLEAAAGIAGLIKTVLSLHHRKLPPHLHFKNPNPHIPWDTLPFRIPTTLTEWIVNQPRIAGVSAFGFSGTNAHILIEEAPIDPKLTKPMDRPSLLLLSAQTLTAVRELAARYAAHLEQNPELDLADVCRTAALGRNHFSHRVAVIADSCSSVRCRLRVIADGELPAQSWMGHVETNELAHEHATAIDTLESAAAAYVNGRDLKWEQWLAKPKGRPVVLPSYPFQRKRYWIESPKIVHQKSVPAIPVSAQDGDTDHLYEIVWERAPATSTGLPRHLIPGKIVSQLQLSSSSPAPVSEREDKVAYDSGISATKKVWLVLCDEHGIGESIASELRRQGQSCICVRWNSEMTLERISSTGSSNGERFRDALMPHVETSTTNYAGIVYCAQANTLSEPVFSDFGCLSALQLFKHLHQCDLPQPPRIWLVTQACQYINGCIQGDHLSQAMLWGLGRSVALEWPELWGGLHDLSGDPDESEINHLVHELLYSNREQVVWRNGEPWIPKLRRRTNVVQRKRLTFRSNGAYLITGGWGTLGSLVAPWLAERGAGLIVLIGRGEPTAKANAVIEKCALYGATVWLKSADCTDLKATIEIVEAIPASGFALRGVFHIAGTGGIRDSIDLDQADFDQVCPAKIEGSKNLHAATRDYDLDYFVLFSSIASVWGSKKQAHYCAANQFLDAFAGWRSSQNLPAISINWGPWLGSRLVNSDTEQMLDKMGILPFSADAALRALESAIADNSVSQIVAVRLDWSRFAPLFGTLPRSEFFQDVVENGSKPTPPKSVLRGGYSMDEKVDRTKIYRRVAGILAELLGYAADDLPGSKIGFFALGVDSVMALDFHRRLEREFGHALPATIAFDHPNLFRLINFLEHTLSSSVSKSEAVPGSTDREVTDSAHGEQSPGRWRAHVAVNPSLDAGALAFNAASYEHETLNTEQIPPHEEHSFAHLLEDRLNRLESLLTRTPKTL
jgi:acyl transferase domain-containing protein